MVTLKTTGFNNRKELIMFNLSDEALKEIGAFNTVRETQSQPKLWIETFALYKRK